MKSSSIVVGKVYAAAAYGNASCSDRSAIDGRFSCGLRKAEVLEVGAIATERWARDRGRTVRVKFLESETSAEYVRPQGIGLPWEEYEALVKTHEAKEAVYEADSKRAMKRAERAVKMLQRRGIEVSDHGGYESDITIEGKALRQLMRYLKKSGGVR